MAELALLGALTGLQTAGVVEQGRAAEQEARFRADALERQARQSQVAGARDAAAITEEGQRRIARQRARLARSGVVLAGSPVLALGETAADAARAAQQARTDANVRADFQRQRAAEAVAGGQSRRFRSLLRAGDTLLRGAPRFGGF